MTYTEFKKLKINTSSIGWEMPSKREPTYFCTPKGAKIIGRAGVDGIHYCTVRGLGDTVFAVSPMNLPGHYIHPIARNFEDFLRLLLACLDLNIIEQAWMWDKEQLTEQIEVLRNSGSYDETTLSAIREKCGLSPMEAPYEYLCELQRSFNYGNIPFSGEYYETVDETVWTPPAWKVTMEGDFFPERGKSGKELPLNKTFAWSDVRWHVPSAYLCKGGIVVDFFAEIEPDVFNKFRREAEETFAQGKQSLPNEEDIMRKNPTNVHFRPTLTVNGAVLQNKRGQGDAWYPASCREDGTEDNVRAKYLCDHYGLDLEKIRIIRRCTFPCEFAIDAVSSLILHMESVPTEFCGIRLKNPSVGDSFNFTHPVHKTEHTLVITDYTAEEIDQGSFSSEEWLFPTHMTAMNYTVTPDLPREEISVRDLCGGDSPRRKETAPKPDCDFISAIGVIRSADGPTAAAVGVPQGTAVHTACSGLYFEKQDAVSWYVSFHVKTTDDLSINLI